MIHGCWSSRGQETFPYPHSPRARVVRAVCRVFTGRKVKYFTAGCLGDVVNDGGFNFGE